MATPFHAAWKLTGEIKVLRNKETGSKKISGCIQPLSTTREYSFDSYTMPGKQDKRRFLLFAPPDGFSLQDRYQEITLVHKGLSYALLRLEPLYFGEQLSHWEGVLRLIGEETP